MLPFISIGGFDISVWRIVALASVALCWILVLARARELKYSLNSIFLWLLLGLPVGTLGGHFFNSWIPDLAGAGSVTYSFSGLTVIGSILSCLLFSFFYAKYVMKIPPMELLDAVAFALPLSILIGRLGCLLNGCCYGKIATLSLKYPALALGTLPVGFYVEPTSAWRDYIGVSPDSAAWNLPLLLMINAFFALIVAERLFRNRAEWNLRPGTVFAATSTLYAGGRFFVEFARKEDAVNGGLFNPWQMALLFLFSASFLWLCTSLRSRSQNRTVDLPKEGLP